MASKKAARQGIVSRFFFLFFLCLSAYFGLHGLLNGLLYSVPIQSEGDLILPQVQPEFSEISSKIEHNENAIENEVLTPSSSLQTEPRKINNFNSQNEQIQSDPRKPPQSPDHPPLYNIQPLKDGRLHESLNQETTSYNAIFYNIYIPNKSTAAQAALAIVEEQVKDVVASLISIANSNANFRSTLYYITIGLPIDETQFQKWCAGGPINCTFVSHYKQGFEDVTLEKLHKYCQKNPTHRVTYLHNKGSFHSNPQQHMWRYSGTMAATHNDCLDPPNKTCNMCSLLWQPFPFFHTSGNFWTAHCSYVSKLIPPSQFGSRLRNFLEPNLMPMLERKQFSLQLYNGIMGASAFGLARYASEAWVSSHPNIVPCDLSVAASMGLWKNKGGRNSSIPIKWAMFPRRSLKDSAFAEFPMGRFQRIVAEAAERNVDFFLLPGLLFRWEGLYNKTPPVDSWVWNFFPDGETWKHAIREFGNSAVAKTTAAFASNRTVDLNMSSSRTDQEFFRHVLTLK